MATKVELNTAQQKFYDQLNPEQKQRMLKILAAKKKPRVIKATGANKVARDAQIAKRTAQEEAQALTI